MYVSKLVEDELWRWAREYPTIEVCGFIDLKAQRVFPVRNVSRKPTVSYTGHQDDTVEALRALSRPFAVYHSHPTRRAVPSSDDIASASYPFQVILSLTYAELRAYEVHRGEWTEVAVSQQNPEGV